VFNYTITGGSGIFDGATGSFTNIGTVDVRGGPPSRLSLNFDGAIIAGAVPEPATWALLLLGFGMLGCGMRTRRARDSLTFA
ncbi:MAG: PEP-CTERM sorting domain-containing protein, partial [Alphaproteobacteria bacterium]